MDNQTSLFDSKQLN